MRRPIDIYIPTVDKITNPTEIPINELRVSDFSFYEVKLSFRTLGYYRKSLRFPGS